MAVVVNIAVEEIGDTLGIVNNKVLKTPIEATEDACSALKCDHTSNSYKAALLYSASS